MTAVDFQNVTFAQLAGNDLVTKAQEEDRKRAEMAALHSRAEAKIARLTQELGRPLSKREATNMETPHEGLDFNHRAPSPADFNLGKARNWKPVRVTDSATASEHDDEIARLEAIAAKDADWRALKDASPSERQLVELKRLKRQEIDARAAQAALTAHARERAPALATLRKLREAAAWDARYSEADVFVIDHAIAQNEEVNGCPVESKRLLKAALAIRQKFIAEQTAAANARAAEIAAERAKLDAELRSLHTVADDTPVVGDVSPPVGDPGEAAYYRALGIAEGDPGKYWEPA